jgi:hypothetical protein
MKPARSVTVSIPLPEWLRVTVPEEKELRVLLPIALCALAVMVAAGRGPEWSRISLLAYFIGCSALGAIAAGHDFTYRTAGWMLSLPVSRRKIWSRRLFIVAALMLPLALLVFKRTWSSGIWSASRWASFEEFAVYICAPALGGLCLAPWLTLISRSPMFGTVFSLGIPFAVLALLSRFEKPELIYAVMPVLWIAGFLLGARKFMTLEIIDGATSASVELPRASAERFRRRSPIVQLFKKEFMLQRLSIGLALISICLTLLLKPDYAQYWTLAYSVALLLLIASIASADERQMGTAEWQTLVPVAFWKQWLIKFAVTWGLAVVVGMALPITVLVFKLGDFQKLGINDGLLEALIFLSASLLVVITLYISSLCNSGLKALLTALLVSALTAFAISQLFDFYVQRIVGPENWAARAWAVGGHNFWLLNVLRMLGPEDWALTWYVRLSTQTSWFHWEYGLFLIALLGFVALAFHFSMNNHRFAERGPRRILRQLATFAAYQALATICLLTIFRWLH